MRYSYLLDCLKVCTRYLLVAAEENHSGACYFLADLYYKAGGLENYQQALSLFERSGVSVWHCLLHI
jgi:TPR repeat protein